MLVGKMLSIGSLMELLRLGVGGPMLRFPVWSMHAMMDTYVGVVTSQVASRVVSSTMTADVTRPVPIRQAYLFVGFRRVPPRFLKLWRIMTLLFASNARTAMLASLVIVVSFVALGVTWAHAWVKTLVSLLPASLVVCEAK